MSQARRILHLSPVSASAAGSYLADALKTYNCEIDIVPISASRKTTLIAKMAATAPDFSKYDAVMTTGYATIFAAALRARITGSKTPIIVVGLNLAAAALKTGIPFVDRGIDGVFQRLDLSIVHSRNEIDLFHEMHGLDKNRFAFAHWGFDLPAYDSRRFAGRTEPYACMIGRNNRDFKTFCAAVEKAGVNGVIIAPAYAKLDFPIPDSIEVYRDIPFKDCLSCIEHALANLILVKDDERGAGHITAVSGMLLGAPQIYSDVSVLGDYLIDGVTGVAAPVGDADAVAAAIRRISENKPQTDQLTAAARDYALTWLSHDATARRQADLIMSVINKTPFEQVDPEWADAVAGLAPHAAPTHRT